MAAALLSYRPGLLIPHARRPDRAARWGAIATAVAFHVVLLALLLSSGPAPHAARSAAPIMIDLIAASIDPPHPAERPKPHVKAPRSNPTQVAPPAIVMAPVDASAALVTPLPPEPPVVLPIDAAVARRLRSPSPRFRRASTRIICRTPRRSIRRSRAGCANKAR